MCSGNCENNANIIMQNQQIIYDKLKEIEAKQCLWTEERICWLEEQVLRNGLETKNHDIKIVRMLESMGAVNQVVDDTTEETLIATMEEEFIVAKTAQPKNKKGVVK